MFKPLSSGDEMHQFASRAMPICRSLTGDGVRQTLEMIADCIPLQIHEVPSGSRVFDWTVPKEWNIRDAFIADESGNRIVDFKKNNLHVVGYSVPVDQWMDLQQLQIHLHSLPDQPDAIPYITSYYKERWGFCLTHANREALEPGKYQVVIDSTLEDGSLSYGECILPGESEEEILITTYVCHPSMANNELSGPTVSAFIGQWLMSAPRRYTYRLIYTPETIGAITYLSRNLDVLKQRCKAGFNLSCIGDDRDYSYVASRYANTLADKVTCNVLNHKQAAHTKYSYLERGSDERQYGSPGVELPLVTLCRTKFGKYPEYHTSLDDLNLVTPSGLQGGFEFVKECLVALEANKIYRVTCLGEPQLGKRGLYPELSTKDSNAAVKTILDVITYADGSNDLIDISNLINQSVADIIPIVEKLVDNGLFEQVGQ